MITVDNIKQRLKIIKSECEQLAGIAFAVRDDKAAKMWRENADMIQATLNSLRDSEKPNAR